ncbi:MAG: hypothetical protein IJ313_13875 [Clostridia bacterium]|nr:hypothetical protein [Clostridia bacterium]
MRMPFEGKFERAHKFEKEQKALREQHSRFGDEITPSDLMEKGDGCTMVIAAMITIVPIALIVIAVLAAAGYFFIIR